MKSNNATFRQTSSRTRARFKRESAVLTLRGLLIEMGISATEFADLQRNGLAPPPSFELIEGKAVSRRWRCSDIQLWLRGDISPAEMAESYINTESED